MKKKFIPKDEVFTIEVTAEGLYMISLKESTEVWYCKKLRANEAGVHGRFFQEETQQHGA